jgi:hypothetical protein
MKSILLAGIACLTLSACATTPMGGSAVGPAVFNADDFAWSTRAGQASIVSWIVPIVAPVRSRTPDTLARPFSINTPTMTALLSCRADCPGLLRMAS